MIVLISEFWLVTDIFLVRLSRWIQSILESE
jgi:hypothetical protein